MRPTLIAVVVATQLICNSTAATLKYCQEPNLQGDCQTVTVNNDGACHNLPSDYNDKVASILLDENSQCTFWNNYDCHGKHTSSRVRLTSDFGNVCQASCPNLATGCDWSSMISSYKCCNTGKWCAGKTPGCENVG
ncbi:hypothetical protein BCR34DRAFT_662032 [Clohesyomyces aquaticus]|uniref:Calcium-dependent cell adhesion molecule N-terminal domain-containing protein n=1 Tax=Clohesyomyces aquaticus TaxID=1231657 RepID=A0A1Y1ZYV5_9PLEO|nr:hypothetical protein BCR34DRAFT_662032 [Clohesyomyces aquaticus]